MQYYLIDSNNSSSYDESPSRLVVDSNGIPNRTTNNHNDNDSDVDMDGNDYQDDALPSTSSNVAINLAVPSTSTGITANGMGLHIISLSLEYIHKSHVNS